MMIILILMRRMAMMTMTIENSNGGINCSNNNDIEANNNKIKRNIFYPSNSYS